MKLIKPRLILLAAALGCAACMADLDIKDEPDTMGTPPRRPAAAAPPAGGYSAGEVARHGSENDCWLTLNGKVYDVTRFIPFHPGGSAILQGCGRDATALFETRPMGSGTAHSAYARQIADGYYAGPAR